MIVHANGVELHYEVVGTGEPLLWLHGFMGAGADWKYIFLAAPRWISVNRAGSARSRCFVESLRRVLVPRGRA